VLFLISLCFHRQGASVFATERADLKLDAQNEPGVFLGFDHLENTFGAVILVKQSLVVARHNVFFVESVFPFKEKKPSFTHWESLYKLIGRKNAITEVHDFDNLLPDTRSDLEPAAASQSHQTQPHDSSSRALDVDPVDLSSDDDEVENLLEQAFEDVQTKSVPSFNPLSSSPVRGSSEWPAAGLLPAGDGGEKEEIEEDTRDMGSADDFNDNQPRRSPRKAKIIASQREKSTSTMVKDIYKD